MVNALKGRRTKNVKYKEVSVNVLYACKEHLHFKCQNVVPVMV